MRCSQLQPLLLRGRYGNSATLPAAAARNAVRGRSPAAIVCNYNKLCGRPPQFATASGLLQVDLESGVRVTCDVGYLCALPILVFLGLSVLDLG